MFKEKVNVQPVHCFGCSTSQMVCVIMRLDINQLFVMSKCRYHFEVMNSLPESVPAGRRV